MFGKGRVIMIYEKVKLSEKYPDCTLTVYAADDSADMCIKPRNAVIVCPGGGYDFLSPREGEPIVKKFFGAEMNVYLLEYSTKQRAADFAPLIESALAVKYVREHAKEHNTDPDKIYVCGFSAGGHLAGSCGILWNIEPVREALGINDGSAPEGINRPNGLILSYPVISGGEYRHPRTICNVTGKESPTDEERYVFSLEKHVDQTTPPIFVWHTMTDNLVPVQNTLLLANACVERKVPIEVHIYPEGPHGLGLATEFTSAAKPALELEHVRTWIDLAIRWINR
jgi:acetyl esterase/lipase